MSNYEVREPVPKDVREELKEYSDFVAHLLYHRGIKTGDEAKIFLNPDYENHTHDPFSLKDIDKAVDRILKAIKDDERITIYTDYDADGLPGGVILHDFLKKVGYQNFDVYIPHRNKEGFGLNKEAIQKIADKGTKLLITIDCGIADINEVALARDLQLDVIITDHHEPNGKCPNAYAIINPKQNGCKYLEKMLCGSGVIFKLVQALIKKGDFDIKEGWEKWLLDMVGIATMSDMVPLQGENRVFAYYGMLVLRKSPRKGLMALFKKTRTKQRTLTDEDVGFTLAPRINAASRMGEPMSAFRMLATDDEVEAGQLVAHLDEINNERKGLVASMVKEIKKDLAKKPPKHVVVHGNPKWKPSLLGLASNSIMDEFKMPVFLWGRGEGKDLKGSCRSDGHVSLIDLMNEVSGNVLDTFGGHKQAGGFEITLTGVDLLEDELNKAYKKVAGKKDDDIKFVDMEIKLSDISEKLFSDINQMSPFGVANEKPVFIFKDVAPSAVETFGKRGEHLKLTFKTPNGNLTAIAFFKGIDSWSKPLEENKPISLIATLEKSFFGYKPELRLRIEDIV